MKTISESTRMIVRSTKRIEEILEEAVDNAADTIGPLSEVSTPDLIDLLRIAPRSIKKDIEAELEARGVAARGGKATGKRVSENELS